MINKAKVRILQERKVEKTLLIEAEVEIKGITRRKRYTLPNTSSNEDIRKHITNKLIEEENRNVVGSKFEVEL